MWARLDDNFPDHPKVRSLGVFGIGLQAAAICYCSRYLTDGFLSYTVADQLIASVMSPFTMPDGVIQTPGLTSGMAGSDASDWDWKTHMVRVGLWEKRRGGFRVHDYLKYNPTRASVLEERAKAASRMAKLRGGRGSDVTDEVRPNERRSSPSPSLRSRSKSKAFVLKGEGGRSRTSDAPTQVGRVILGPPPTFEEDTARLKAIREKP